MNTKKSNRNKNNLFFSILMAVAVLLPASCIWEETTPGYRDTVVPIRFDAQLGNVETKVSNSSGDHWDTTDTIGVYMILAGNALSESAIREGAKNKPYIISSGDGTNTASFVAATDTIYYPNGEMVNFIAYYPYSTSQVASGYTYLMDISDQSDPSRLDLLYSNNHTAYSSANHDAVLPFEHLMTRVVFDAIMAPGNKASLTGLQLEMQNLNTATSFDLSDGTPASDGAGQSLIIPFTHQATDDSVRMEATLIPMADASGVRLSFLLNGKSYSAPLPPTTSGMALLKGNRYTYKVLFDEADITLEGHLTPWDEEPNDTIAPVPQPPFVWINGYSGPVTVDYASGGRETLVLNSKGRANFSLAYRDDVINSLTLNNAPNPADILIGNKVTDALPLWLKVDASGNPVFRDAVNGYIPISSVAELQMIGDPANLAGKYKQRNSIDLLDEPWTPIGTNAALFTGEYDGGEYEISNLEINVTTFRVGLFGYANNATLRNIRLVSGSVTGNNQVAGICGEAIGNTFIDNCHSNVDITATGRDVAGICGSIADASTTIITSCRNTGKMTSTGAGVVARNIGGIVGWFGGGKAINCENTGEIKANRYVGGIAGRSNGDVMIIACRNSGAVINMEENWAGGIIGANANNTALTITACYNTGAVSGSGTGTNAGGIIGELLTGGTITSCYSTGTVTGNAATTGLICGTNAETISSCYWTAGSGSTATRGIGADTGTSDTKEFGDSAWPADTDTGWGIGNGSAPNTYWKSLGGWNTSTPVYPALWWE
ncbi:MAG: fimbrillin family protein [Tannerellaceae bacterium]|jgi:hypothetical protein|nr:fimbrillin family protein [Tannerellaceae bacterium]